MTIPRVKPAGWSFGEKLTSAQITDLDTNASHALDKTTAGDALVGPVTVSGAGRIRTTTGGRLELGDGDWPTFTDAAGAPLARTRSIVVSAAECFVRMDDTEDGSGNPPWVQSLTWVKSPGYGASRLFMLPAFDGGTLTQVQFSFVPDAAYAIPTGPGTNTPNLRVQRMAHNGTAADQLAADFGAGSLYAGTWNDGGVKLLTGACDQNNVIDRSTYFYYVELFDALAPTPGPTTRISWHSIKLTFSMLSMQVP